MTVQYTPGTLTVSSGGQAFALNVTSSPVYNSGTFLLSDDGDGGTDIQFLGPGDVDVPGGQSSASIAVGAGHYLSVESGGTANNVTLDGSGELLFAQSSHVDGGELIFLSGQSSLALDLNRSGTESSVTIQAGGNLVNGGLVQSVHIAGEGLLFNVGTADGVTIAISGIELDIGEALNVVVNGGL
jgi:hypothetical protein